MICSYFSKSSGILVQKLDFVSLRFLLMLLDVTGYFIFSAYYFIFSLYAVQVSSGIA